MRDIVKRKRDEHLKMVWRVNFAHKRLQSRIEHMRKFRRQHEQLRTVIVRVLRPSSSSSAMTVRSATSDVVAAMISGKFIKSRSRVCSAQVIKAFDYKVLKGRLEIKKIISYI